MLNGLWTVEFISSFNRYGKGVVIINDNRILGGDASYYYTGTCEIENNKIIGMLTIIKYAPEGISIFGNLDHFQLSLEGQIDEIKFNATASVKSYPNAQINIIGTKREDF